MLALQSSSNPVILQEENFSATTKKKRRPAGTPDPDAEVVSLSPKTLLESDRYICQICNQGFRRDQNLQMHLRRHKIPWKLLKKEKSNTQTLMRKRVYVCPEPSCLHHDPAHALGDLVGIKKHFRRKHGGRRQWICLKCSKSYAVQSDYKAHAKTCGTRGHSCDCGRVFSRVESFIEHQDKCQLNCFSNVKPPLRILDLELQLLSRPTNTLSSTFSFSSQQSSLNIITKLCLSLGPMASYSSWINDPTIRFDVQLQIQRLVEEKNNAENERETARKDIELAERELLAARKMRKWAQTELLNALAFKETTSKMLVQITCDVCRMTSRIVTRVAGEV